MSIAALVSIFGIAFLSLWASVPAGIALGQPLIAVILTAFTTNLLLLGGTRWLEGASTAASVPSILGYIAMVTANDQALRGRAAARFDPAWVGGRLPGLTRPW